MMDNVGATSLKIEQDIMTGSVKVVFDRDGKRYTRSCEYYPDSLDNLRTIGLQIEYLYRALEVMPVDGSEMDFETIFAGLLATPDDTALLLGAGDDIWYLVLGVDANATADDVRNAFRALAKIHHPQNGGDAADFRRLRKAYDDAMNAISQRPHEKTA